MQDISLASVMGALTAQSQSKRLFMFCFKTMVYLLSNMSAESVENPNAEGVKKSMEDVFQGVGATSLENRLVGINLNGGSVNMGRTRGVATFLINRHLDRKLYTALTIDSN